MSIKIIFNLFEYMLNVLQCFVKCIPACLEASLIGRMKFHGTSIEIFE